MLARRGRGAFDPSGRFGEADRDADLSGAAALRVVEFGHHLVGARLPVAQGFFGGHDAFHRDIAFAQKLDPFLARPGLEDLARPRR